MPLSDSDRLGFDMVQWLLTLRAKSFVHRHTLRVMENICKLIIPASLGSQHAERKKEATTRNNAKPGGCFYVPTKHRKKL